MHLQTVMSMLIMLMECSSCILFLRSAIMLTGVYCAAADGTSSTWCLGMGQRRVANTGFCFKATQEGGSCTEWESQQSQVHTSLMKASWLILTDWIMWRFVFSCFSEIKVPPSSSFSVSFFCFFGFDSSSLRTLKNFLFYFVFQIFVGLLNQHGSIEKCAKTAAEFQCHLRTQHSTESRGQYLTENFFWWGVWHTFSKAFSKLCYITISIFIKDSFNLKQL